jgi:predicted ATPase/DNA-binding XRE family transcriptional regulator
MNAGAHDRGSFGTVLQRLRRKAGLSQQELAERAGLSLRGIADLERGARRSPYPATVRRLIQALALSEFDRAALLDSAGISEPVVSPTQGERTQSVPRPLSSFVGRERDKATIQRLLEDVRLVTLSGTGGIGKTRLAIEVADSTDAVAFVDLASVSDPDLVGAVVAEAIGIRKQPSVPLERLLARWLSSRSFLLVLDNCEHLLQACGSLAAALLSECPGLRILATSRQRLGVPGEVSWRVPSLPIPDAGASDRVLEYEAVQLFLERATAVNSGFSLTPQNAATIAVLVRRLNGIPLAIELAAARVNVLSVEQIVNRLDDSVRLLVGGSLLAPARQQTLQATFEWSYGMLSEVEQRLFGRLSVFSGGWTLAAAEEVCSDDASEHYAPGSVLQRTGILDVLAQLIDKSLVLSHGAGADELRYGFLEPLRQFAATRLAEHDRVDVLRQRHARCFAGLVAESAAQYHTTSETAALERIHREHANVQAALDWLLDEPSRRDEAVGLAKGLWWYWAARDHWTEATSRLERLLEKLPADTAEPTELDLLWMAGSIAWMRGDLARANALIDRCVLAARAHHHMRVLARSLGIAAQLAAVRGDYATARKLSNEGLPLARETGERWSEARYLDGLALLAIEQGQFGQAASWLSSSLALARAMGDRWSEAAALNKLGDVSRAQGEHAGARRFYEDSLRLVRGEGDELRASVLHNLGYVAIAQGDDSRAIALFTESAKLCRARGEQRGIAECLVGFACVAAMRNQRTFAARLFGAADAALRNLGTELSPSNRVDYRRGLDLARGDGPDAFAAAYASGQGLSLEEALANVFAMRGGISDGRFRMG